MRVLVTGGAGYIGSHVAARLRADGHLVRIVDNLSTGHEEAVAKLEKVDLVKADLRNPRDVSHAFGDGPWDAVVHLAASSLVGESVEAPAYYYENNVIAGFHLLEAMRRHGTKRLVFSSSAAVYGAPDTMAITEATPPRPENPYGATKLAFEDMLRAYDDAYGLRSVSLRYFNVAGADVDAGLGEDHHPETHLIPNLLKAAMGEGEPFQLFGEDYPTPDGTCIRDYIHVADVAEAHVTALSHLSAGGATRVYNLGNGAGFSVRQVWEVACQVTGRQIPIEVRARRAGDPPRLVASAHRIAKELGWRPRNASLTAMVESAWQWANNHPSGYGANGVPGTHSSKLPAGELPDGLTREHVAKPDGRYLVYYEYDPDPNSGAERVHGAPGVSNESSHHHSVRRGGPSTASGSEGDV